MKQSENSRYTAQLEELTRLMSFFNEKAEKAARRTLIEKLGNLGPDNSRGQKDYKQYAKEIDPVLALAVQNKPEEAKKLLRQIAQAYIAEAQDVRNGKGAMLLDSFANGNANMLGIAFLYAKFKLSTDADAHEKTAQRHEFFARKIAETMVKM